jgi:cytochrome c oxidase subunit 2
MAAKDISDLFWWMSLGGAIVWLTVAALTVYSARRGDKPMSEQRARSFIIGGGVVVTTLILAGLLVYGLRMLPPMVAAAPAGSLKIKVVGEQWWWRVRYQPAAGAEVELANEIRLPVNETVQFELESSDVIHSFWIPSLGGKMDMIPGRETRLILHPTRTGIFRGVCAEYCGASHALMAFDVVVMEKAEFASWLEHQRSPAAAPSNALAKQGHDLFFANGCSACHSIAGTPAKGDIGPDLTHLGSRISLGAGTMSNTVDRMLEWIQQTDKIKPGGLMPHFGMLPPDELRALAAYLESLT